MGALSVRGEKRMLNRTVFAFVIICRTPSTSEGWLWRQPIPSPAVRVLPEGLLGRAKPHGIIAACFLLLVTVVGNGRGVIVGCLQQCQKGWGFIRIDGSRAVWLPSLHDTQQHQQQREKSWREQNWVLRQLELNGSATSRGGGEQIWSSWWFF